jgi:hypothetical protein
MLRFVTGLALIAAGLQAASEDSLTFELPPAFSVASSYPPQKSSDSINLFTSGPYGGLGTFLQSPSIPLENEKGQRTVTAKAILYSPGCEFQTFRADIPLQGSIASKFECRQLPTIPLRGSISGQQNMKGMRLHLVYEAPWSHGVFGIIDGAIASFEIGQTTADASGRFTFDVPDFSKDAVHRSYNATPYAAGYLVIVGENGDGTITFLPKVRKPNTLDMFGIRVQERYEELDLTPR